MIDEILERLRNKKLKECETCSCGRQDYCKFYLMALDDVRQQVKSVDLADVGKQRELLIAFKTWETENDIKNLKPDQLVDFFLEDGN